MYVAMLGKYARWLDALAGGQFLAFSPFVRCFKISVFFARAIAQIDWDCSFKPGYLGI
jgi:hypothetical protein